eukprot:6466213-Pyramimonas_sp.AAC.1
MTARRASSGEAWSSSEPSPHVTSKRGHGTARGRAEEWVKREDAANHGTSSPVPSHRNGNTEASGRAFCGT